MLTRSTLCPVLLGMAIILAACGDADLGTDDGSSPTTTVVPGDGDAAPTTPSTTPTGPDTGDAAADCEDGAECDDAAPETTVPVTTVPVTTVPVTTVPATTVPATDKAESSTGPLPLSEVATDAGPTAEPFAFAPDAADCGFETVYGPSVVVCAIVAGAGGTFAIVGHDPGGAGTRGFVTCGTSSEQVPTLALGTLVDAGSWDPTEDGSDEVGYAVIDLDPSSVHLVVVSQDRGVGESGCPIVYDVGEWPRDVTLGAQHGSLRIVSGDERWCVTETDPGAFQLLGPADGGVGC